MAKIGLFVSLPVLTIVLLACSHAPKQVAAASGSDGATPIDGQSSPGRSMQIKVSSTQRTYACHGNKVDSVQVTGSSNILTITGQCGSLQVTGSSNSVTVDSVASIQFTDESSSNSVLYRSGPAPSVNDNGTSNSVARASRQSSAVVGSSGGPAVSANQNGQTTVVGGDLGAALSAATSATAGLAGGVNTVQTDSKGISLVVSKQRMTKNCGDGKTVNINGYQNDITLHGSCNAVNINGWGNTVYVEEVGQIEISGHTNRITWERARNGSKPQVQIVGGMDNSIQRSADTD